MATPYVRQKNNLDLKKILSRWFTQLTGISYCCCCGPRFFQSYNNNRDAYNTTTNQSFAHKLVYDFGYAVGKVDALDSNIGTNWDPSICGDILNIEPMRERIRTVEILYRQI